MAQIVASMCSNLLLTPQNSTIVIGAPATKGDHLLVNAAQLVKFQSYLCTSMLLWFKFARSTFIAIPVYTVLHCKNGIVIMTYSLSFWLQMWTWIQIITLQFIKRNDELSFIVIIAYVQCNYMCPGV